MPSVYNRGVHIHYEVAGVGPPLVLHHGFSQSLETWYATGYVEALKPTYRLILIDSRGHGTSDKPHDPDAYGLKERATDVVSVLDALDIGQAHYFGYSLGGWVGFGLAKYAPERVSSLSLGGAQSYGQDMGLYREMLEQGLADCLAVLEKAVGISVPEEMRKRFFENDAQALLAAYWHDRPDISDLLPTMTMPCLLFAGEADPLHPAIQRCAAELPKATFFTLPGLNHYQVAFQIRRVLPELTKFLATVPVQNTNPYYVLRNG
jgi:pimeloyl-ACP methyl ester carboxylesterase